MIRVTVRGRGGFAVMTVVVCLVVSACASHPVVDPGPRKQSSVPAAHSALAEATWIVEAEPTTLDPIYDYGYYDNTIIANMCEPLVRMNADLSTTDWLATSKKLDDTTWVYDLKPGVTFWDASPVRPEDVVYSLERNVGADTDSYFGSYFTRVKSVSKTGPSQVTVTLSKPDALWNSSTIVTAGAYIVSESFAKRVGKRFGSPGTGVMCTGPYKFSSWTSGDSVTMEKYEGYWNKAVDVRTQKVRFIFVTDSAAQANALTSGRAQGMYLRDQTILPQLERSGGHVYLGPGLTYFFVAPTLKPGPMGDPRIRQALSKALDRQAIVDKIFAGAGVPSRSLVGEDAWGPNPAVRAIYEAAFKNLPDEKVDLDAAKALVSEAGTPKQKIVLAYPTEGGSYQLKLASVVQDAGKRIGLNVSLMPLSPTVSAQLYQDPKGMAAAGIDMISLSFNVNNADPFGMYQIFDPQAGIVDNYSGFNDPAATKLLAQAAGTYDDVERARLTAAAEKIIMDRLPMIPILSSNAVVFMSKGVTGAPASFSQIWSAWAAELGAP